GAVMAPFGALDHVLAMLERDLSELVPLGIDTMLWGIDTLSSNFHESSLVSSLQVMLCS
ncbi:hypothetical protein PIB30_087399, partial [Stylosanthes scabra]|nr:hypothetical protein [Stylosanthes scabra]